MISLIYGKLIIRNFKHSIRDYLIYFLTLILTVGLFYGFLSISSKHFQTGFPVQYDLKGMQGSVKYAVIAIAFFLVFLIQYVNNQMLGQKQKEFALITLMGLDQRSTALLFFWETFFIGLAAIGFGVLLGTLFSQIVSAVVLRLYGLPYHFRFSLYSDTLLITLSLFLILFILVGLSNIRTIRKRKIIDMLNDEKKVDSDFKKEKTLLPWVLITDTGALYLCIFGWYGVYSGMIQRFQANTLFWLFCGAVFPSLFILASIMYFRNMTRDKSSSQWIAILSGTGLLSAVSAISLFQLLHMTDFYPVCAILFFLFSVFSFFDCLSGLLLWVKKKFPRLHYQNLFLFGQFTAKLKTTSRTIGVLSIVLLGAAAFLAFAQPIAESKARYQASRISTEFVIVDRWWLSESMEDLPKSDFSFFFVDQYLQDSGYILQDAAAISFYFLDDADFYRRDSNNIPDPQVSLGISLSDYNHLRRMTGFPEIQIADNQFALHCGLGHSPDMTDQFLKNNPVIKIKTNSFFYSNLALYDNVGEFVNDSSATPVVILPDSACLPLTIAEINYFGNTTQPLDYDFVPLFNREISDTVQSEALLKTAPYYPLVFTKTEQVNESVMWAVLLTLTFTYLGIVLLVSCFTVLSLQQLYDSIKHRSRFQLLWRLGVSQTEICRSILKQLGFWFCIPISFALIGIGGFLPVIMQNPTITDYVGKMDLLLQVGFALLVLLILMLCYFTATYLLFQWNVMRRK